MIVKKKSRTMLEIYEISRFFFIISYKKNIYSESEINFLQVHKS